MDSKEEVKKRDKKNEKETKMLSQNIKMTPNEDNQNANKADNVNDSASSTDSEELVNALNYNTITSLAALKDIIQGDNDTPETDSFFQHYFMNHCNNLSSHNSNSTSPFPFTERRRLSQCREEDEDDEKNTVKHKSNGSINSNSEKSVSINSDGNSKQQDESMEKEDDKQDIESSELQDSSKRTVIGAKHKFLVTKAETPAPIERALRMHVNNAHTVHFGTQGAEEQRPSVRTIFTGQNLHRDKNYFDSSLIEIRSTVDGLLTSSEDIWVKRTEDKSAPKSDSSVVPEVCDGKVPNDRQSDHKISQGRERSGTWGSQTVPKEEDLPKKTTKDKDVRRSSDERRQKREQRLDAAITRSSQSVGERRRRGSADDGQAHHMYQQTIHGTSGVSRRPALFDMFKSRTRSDAKKQPSIMQQVKAAVQSMTKSGTTSKESVKSDTAKTEVQTSSSSSTVVKTKDGSAHPHSGSDTRYYHTVTASTSRRPSAMAKVMDIFRGRSSVPGPPVTLESVEKRRAMSWESEQERLTAMLEAIISDTEDNVAVESDASIDEDYIQISEHNSMSEQDVSSSVESEDEEPETHERERFYLAKDKITKWYKIKGRTAVRTRSHNIVTEAPGPKGKAQSCKSPFECFQLFITDDIIAEITSCTNVYIEKNSQKYARQRDCKKTEEIEIKALIGLLILSGLCKSSHRRLRDLWDESRLGIGIFHKTMSYNRFSFLLKCLRFDNVNTRETRKSTDRFAPIRNIFEQFNKQCADNYSLNENFTIDEQLLKFRGRCIFRQYIPNKPGRYGLKNFALCDAKTFYTYKSEPYLGQQPDGLYKVSYKPTDIVMRLCSPILGSGRNLTCDNWYSNLQLAEELLKNKITMVGTLRKNKKEIPAAFLEKRAVGTSIFGFHYKFPLTLVSYCPKKKKNVLLISTLHDNNDNVVPTATNEGKPEIVLFYNETKGGVDTADQMCGNYSISRICSRWPLRYFFHILDTSGINAYVIYNWNSAQSQEKIKRSEYLENVGLSMVQDHIEKRSTQQALPKALKRTLNAPGSSREGVSPTKKQRCIVCPRSKDIKTMSHCNFCKKSMCQKHMKFICTSCYEN